MRSDALHGRRRGGVANGDVRSAQRFRENEQPIIAAFGHGGRVAGLDLQAPGRAKFLTSAQQVAAADLANSEPHS
jgi:hypothetical protein